MSFLARMCGCRMLNAEEKSVNNCLTVLFGEFQILNDVYGESLDIVNPRPVLYANWRGSICEPSSVIIWFLMTLSIAFIARQVSATGQSSFMTFMLHLSRR